MPCLTQHMCHLMRHSVSTTPMDLQAPSENCMFMQVPLFEVNVEYEDGRMQPWSLSPLQVTAMSVSLTTKSNPSVVQGFQYALLPGTALQAAFWPAADCVFQKLDTLIGGKNTSRCADMHKALDKDLLLTASNATNYVKAFVELVPNRSSLMAGSASACMFLPLCVLFNVPLGPLGSIIIAVYGAFSGGLTILMGPLAFLNLLAILYVLIMPEAVPKGKGPSKAQTKVKSS